MAQLGMPPQERLELTLEPNMTISRNSLRNKDAAPSPVDISLPASRLEICEKRLVLSAQLLMDLDISDTQVDAPISLHGEMGMLPNLELHGVDSPGIELHSEIELPATPHELNTQPHLSDAHHASGWTQVRQQFGLGGQRQTVAVIDSGIAWDHEALGGGYGSEYRRWRLGFHRRERRATVR